MISDYILILGGILESNYILILNDTLVSNYILILRGILMSDCRLKAVILYRKRGLFISE